jgi:hypothetical protein
MRVLRENRRAPFLAVLVALALLVSFAIVRDGTSSGTLNRTMSAGTSLQVSCEGTSLTTTSTSATTVNLNCLTRAPAVPVAVGHATTFSSGDSGSPKTALPAGATTGDVLVSYVESYSFTSISCKEGWTRVFDTTSSGGARLVACTTVVEVNQASPEASVSPPHPGLDGHDGVLRGQLDLPGRRRFCQLGRGIAERDDRHGRHPPRLRRGKRRLAGRPSAQL